MRTRVLTVGCLLVGLCSGYLLRNVSWQSPTWAQGPQPPANSGRLGNLPSQGQPTTGLRDSGGNPLGSGQDLQGVLPAANSYEAFAKAAASGGAMASPADSGQYLPEELVNMAVYERANRSVVHISTKSLGFDAFRQVRESSGSGSGSVLDRNGLILTNFHVIEDAREIAVRLFNGRAYAAKLIGADKDTDIAVLRIDAPSELLEPIGWGDSQNLRVGQRIYAIGNPFGLERTMSTGMISSLNRQIPSSGNRTIRSLIQIDASINQGNSGGPLINTRGQLIGMNTAIMSSDGDSAGVGFAIPSATLLRIVPQLLKDGRVLRPTIGILRVYETDDGLLLVLLAPDGPAERAGLRGFQISRTAGPLNMIAIDPSNADLLKAIDGQVVRTADDMLAVIEEKQAGQTVTVTIERSGQRIDVPVSLAGPG